MAVPVMEDLPLDRRRRLAVAALADEPDAGLKLKLQSLAAERNS